MSDGGDAFETVGDADHPGPFFFTCEHASNALPPGLRASPSDRAWLDDHWGWDIGARDVVVRLVERFGGRAVLGRYSRLVVDLNRAPGQAGFVRHTIADQPVALNAALDAAELARRTAAYHAPYHAAIAAQLAATRAAGEVIHLVAVHSFTPLYLGQARAVEVGVLFDRYPGEAEALHRAVAAQGFRAELNQPFDGLGPHDVLYSARRHGDGHGTKYLELEIRHDLIDTRERARAVADRLAVAFESFRPPAAAR